MVNQWYFKEVSMYVNSIESQQIFFNQLGYDTYVSEPKRLSVKLGRTILHFLESKEKQQYHYCWLVSSEKFKELKSRIKLLNINIIPFEGEEEIENESWNSKSLYFVDPNQNMPEIIVHRTLNDPLEEQIAEVAFISGNTFEQAEKIRNEIGIQAWKATTSRFLDIGYAGTMFILVDPKQKPNWFPYDYPVSHVRWSGILADDDESIHFDIENGVINFTPI